MPYYPNQSALRDSSQWFTFLAIRNSRIDVSLHMIRFNLSPSHIQWASKTDEFHERDGEHLIF